MTDATPQTPPVRDDQEAPDDIWTLARDLYLAGQTGTAVCDALDLKPSTFWKRAADEKWLRRDRPRGAPDLQPLDMDAPVDDLPQARDKAWRRVCRALDQGRDGEALRWYRLHTLLDPREDQARDHRARATQDQSTLSDLKALSSAARLVEAQARAELGVLQAQFQTGRLEKVESTPTTPQPSRPLDPKAEGLTRAERRRRQKYLARHMPVPTATSGAIAGDKPSASLLTDPP